MPIDPNIALSVKTPQFENALDVAQKSNQLQTSQLQGEAAVQQMQSGALDIQQKQMQMASTQAVQRALHDSGGDLDQASQLATQYGALPSDVMNLRNTSMSMRTNYAKMTTEEAAALNAKKDIIHPLVKAVLAETDPAKQKTAWNQMHETAVQQGAETAAQAAQLPYPGPDGVQRYDTQLNTLNWMQKQAEQETAAARKTTAQTGQDRLNAELPELQSKAAQAKQNFYANQLANVNDPVAHDHIRTQAIVSGVDASVLPPSSQVYANGQKTPEGQTALQRIGMTDEQKTQADAQARRDAQNAQPKTEAELAVVAADSTKPQAVRDNANAALKRLDASKIAARPIIQTIVPGLGAGQGGATSEATGDAYLNTLPPGTANQVRAIAEGRAALPSGSTRSQAAIQLRQAVFQYDPTYSDQRAQVRKALTTGIDGRNIGALNTATVHLDQLGDAATALNNGSFTPANGVYQKFKQMFGSAAPTNFEGLRAAVSGEMANALKGVATDPEIASIKGTIDKTSSPQQLAGQINNYLGILRVKLGTYQQRYQQQIPGDSVWSPVLPSAQQVFSKHGVSGPDAPPAATSYANTATGQNGHKVGTNDAGKTWYDVQTGQKVQ